MSKNIKYDREDVIQKATNLYWEKGFHGTSMRNLQDVIDMRPGSIYATFGSKEGLYKEALQHYSAQGHFLLESCLKSDLTPINTLKSFIKNLIIGRSDNAPSCMCMLVKTVSELTEENHELLSEAKNLLNAMEKTFASVLEQAQNNGELDKTKDVNAIARYLQIQLMGLRTYLHVNHSSEDEVDALIEDLFARAFI